MVGGAVVLGCERAGHDSSYEPTEEEIDAVMVRATGYERMVAATNRLVFARATNVWNRLRNGADFATLAREFTEAEEGTNCVNWGEFPISAFAGEPELSSAVAAMKPGEFSPPVEGDNGLMIVRLNSRSEGNVDLDRIFFRLPEIPAPVSRDEVVKFLKDRAKSESGRH